MNFGFSAAERKKIYTSAKAAGKIIGASANNSCVSHLPRSVLIDLQKYWQLKLRRVERYIHEEKRCIIIARQILHDDYMPRNGKCVNRSVRSQSVTKRDAQNRCKRLRLASRLFRGRFTKTSVVSKGTERGNSLSATSTHNFAGRSRTSRARARKCLQCIQGRCAQRTRHTFADTHSHTAVSSLAIFARLPRNAISCRRGIYGDTTSRATDYRFVCAPWYFETQ